LTKKRTTRYFNVAGSTEEDVVEHVALAVEDAVLVVEGVVVTSAVL
jgi:hypothetical protein